MRFGFTPIRVQIPEPPLLAGPLPDYQGEGPVSCTARLYEAIDSDGQPSAQAGETMLVARTWRGWVSTERAAAYVEYVTRTGLSAYKQTPGNLGAQMWTKDLGDGRTEVMTVSWWSSRADIEAFAGPDIAVAVFYPEDDGYLVDRETTVTHYEVARTV